MFNDLDGFDGFDNGGDLENTLASVRIFLTFTK